MEAKRLDTQEYCGPTISKVILWGFRLILRTIWRCPAQRMGFASQQGIGCTQESGVSWGFFSKQKRFLQRRSAVVGSLARLGLDMHLNSIRFVYTWHAIICNGNVTYVYNCIYLCTIIHTHIYIYIRLYISHEDFDGLISSLALCLTYVHAHTHIYIYITIGFWTQELFADFQELFAEFQELLEKTCIILRGIIEGNMMMS